LETTSFQSGNVTVLNEILRKVVERV
jgi:hypothetical protein